MMCEVVRTKGWCGVCYAARRGREASHYGRRRPETRDGRSELEIHMAMVRPSGGSVARVGQPARDEVLHGWLPALHDHLTETQWDDGKPRKTSTVLIMTENGYWKASIHDRDMKAGAWVTAEAWEELLETLNRKLIEGSLEWRKDTR